jgi:hypothetical protein
MGSGEPAEFPTGVKEALTLLGKLKTRSKACLQTMFESQRDRVHSSGEAHSHGIEIDRCELPNRVGLGHVCEATADGKIVVCGTDQFVSQNVQSPTQAPKCVSRTVGFMRQEMA